MSKEKDPKTRRTGAAQEGGAKGGVPTGKSWFLGIGINQYPAFPPLRNAVKDIENVRDLLIEKYDLEEEGVVLLKDGQATRAAIMEQLYHLVQQVQESDKLIIYYSGHGHLDKRTNRGYWVPHDALEGRPHSYVSNTAIRDYINDIKSLHTLLISDSCFSGTLFVRGASRTTEVLTELETLPSRWAICSGRHDEEVLDGTPGGNSPFAESILDVLKRNRDGAFNVAKLADRVVVQTRSNYTQLPEGSPLYQVGHKGGQYVFRLKADEEEDWITCQEQNTIEELEQFLLKYPAGKYAAEAGEQIVFLKEEANWEAARKRHSVAAYQQYIWNHPEGRYRVQAKEAVRLLEEEQDWKRALRRNRVSTFQQYLDDYPDGNYRTEASKKIRDLVAGQEELELWQRAVAGGRKEELEAYLHKYPQGQFVAEAQAHLALLQKKEGESAKALEKEAFDRAKQTHTQAGYQAFLQAYPESVWAAAARKALQELESAAEDNNWQVAKKENSKSAYERYLSLYPHGKYRSDAEARIKRIRVADQKELNRTVTREKKAAASKEQEAWTKAKQIHTPAAYQQFIASFPSSTYAATAKSIISKISLATGNQPGAQEMEKAAKNRTKWNGERLPGPMKINWPWAAGLIGVLVLFIWFLSSFGRTKLPEISFGIMSDARDGQDYKTIIINGQEWLAENLNYEVKDSWWYDNDPENGKKYGRLYTWEAAQAACPPGWRVPTDEEWKALTKSFGGYYGFETKKEVDGAKRSYKALIEGGSSGFNALLGGWRYSDGSFYDLGEGGNYWSSTAEGAGDAWYYNFDGYDRELGRYYNYRSSGRSCRCLKD